jgi:hypothetical protein
LAGRNGFRVNICIIFGGLGTIKFENPCLELSRDRARIYFACIIEDFEAING